jgi:hypothetical protein
VAGQLRYISAYVATCAFSEALEGSHVLLGNEPKREVDAAGRKVFELRRQIEAVLVVDALDAMQGSIFEQRSPENLERAVVQPL